MEELIKIGQAFLQTPQGEKILKKVSQFKGTKEEFLAKKEELLKAFRVRIQAYTVKGTVTNAQTSKPLPGVEVKPLFAIYPIKQETKTKKAKRTRSILESNVKMVHTDVFSPKSKYGRKTHFPTPTNVHWGSKTTH